MMPRTMIYAAMGLLGLAQASLAASPPATPVIVYEAKRVAYVDTIEALGTLRANETVNITANVTEKVTKILFDDGQRVAAGDVLIEMTSEEESAQLQEERSTRAEAAKQLERVRTLAESGSAPKSLLDQRKREYETANARLRAIESRMDDRLIKAPFAGVVGLRNISVGALVEPGDEVTTLDDDTVMKLDFSVPDTFLDVLKIGQKIEARARAFEGKVFEGVVKSLGSQVDTATRSIAVRAEVPNPDQLLKPGMLMSVMLLKNPRDAILIPEESVTSAGKISYVFVVGDEQKAERREVITGSRQRGVVEVVSGVEAGERVVTHGTLRLQPNQVVRVIATDDGTLTLEEMLSQDKPAEAEAE